MSVIRDIRLLIARHLDLPSNTRTAIVDVLNLLDASLDTEGYEPTTEIVEALKKLDQIILSDSDDEQLDIFDESEEEDTEDYIDLEDIEYEDEEDDDDEGD